MTVDSDSSQSAPSNKFDMTQADACHKELPLPHKDSDQPHLFGECTKSSESHEPNPLFTTSNQTQPQNQEKFNRLVSPQKITVNQPIGRLSASSGQDQNGPVTVSGRIGKISDEAIRNNRETEEGIRKIPRFQNYQHGELSNVGLL